MTLTIKDYNRPQCSDAFTGLNNVIMFHIEIYQMPEPAINEDETALAYHAVKITSQTSIHFHACLDEGPAKPFCSSVKNVGQPAWLFERSLVGEVKHQHCMLRSSKAVVVFLTYREI